MKARDVLAEAVAIPPRKSDPTALVAVLLAQTSEGEGVYIAPDGTLMRVRVAVSRYELVGKNPLYRLVPIEEATDD